jgi:hypothetical protein
VVTGINNGLQASFFEDYSITTLGLRYEVATNIAFKTEFSKYDNKIEPVASPEDAIDTNVFKVSLNYVF